jgi:DNA-directed RNA polymerase subunit beta
MNKIFINNIGNLSEAQHASFYHFLSVGISEELKNFPNPFFTEINFSSDENSYEENEMPENEMTENEMTENEMPENEMPEDEMPEDENKLPCFVYLYPGIKLKGPNHTTETCLKHDLSYNIQLFLEVEYLYQISDILGTKKIPENQEIIEIETNDNTEEKTIINKKLQQIRIRQDLFFGEIPFMTEEGTFILNGCERVVISQIIRSPGLYFRKEFSFASKKTISYTATIISNNGLWTKFTLDHLALDPNKKKVTVDRIYIKLNDFKRQSNETDNFSTKKEQFVSNKNKLFIYDFIKYFGLSLSDLLDSLKYPKYIKKQQLKNKDLNKPENLFLIKKFFLNPRSGGFSLGKIGRYKINKKLGLNLPKTKTYLTALDLIGIIDGLIELRYLDRTNDDIDDIKNKLIRSVGDLLQNQLRLSFYRFQKSLKNTFNYFSTKEDLEIKTDDIKISEILEKPISRNQFYQSIRNLKDLTNSCKAIINPRAVTNSVKNFFITSQLSQYMDQTNPFAELTHKRRISVFGPNGLKRDHISNVIRDIHPSQYGRICPIETPEGQNAGLINSITIYGRISALGSIDTPYFLIENGRIFSEKSPIFLNPEQESNTKIAFCDLSVSSKQEIEKKYISIKENYSFSVQKKEEVNFMTTSPLQIISLGSALIPFIEHDDANRALMGSNMQRQAVPLLYPKKPIIGTGFESIAILDSSLIIKSYSEGRVITSSSYCIQIKDNSNQTIYYYLKKSLRSNQETALNQRPLVWPGEKVFSGQIIADGPSTLDGELALGRNLLIAYMPWEGYNYEDAIVLNERLILKDCLTSVHIEEYETNLIYCLNGNEKLTRKLPYLTQYIRRHLNKNGIVKIGSYVKENDILVGKLTPCEEDPTPQTKFLNALYPQFSKEKNYRDTSLRVSKGTEGRVIDIRVTSTILMNDKEQGFSGSSEIIKIYIAQIRKIQIGDKLAGRHGNKGIISRILPSIDMPYLPDGRPIDILLNPLGVPSRMNVGQVFECLLGFAGQKLGKRFLVSPFDEIYGKEASRILINQKLKEAALKDNENWVFNLLHPGKVMLRDGRTGEYFDNPITIGTSYILKLIHLVEDKIHARSTGPYAMITEQPLAGKAQKGGQRFGEMEVWALEAYGCANTLQELLTVKSDDMEGRNDIYESILLQQEDEKPTPSIPEAFLTLVRELNALGLDFSFNKIDNGFVNNLNIKKIQKDIFKNIEKRLKLRALLARYKAEYFAKPEFLKQKKNKIILNKITEKKKILKNYHTLQRNEKKED